MKNAYIYIEGTESDISDALSSMMFSGLVAAAPRFEGVGAGTITLGATFSCNITSDEIALPDLIKINGATGQVCELGGTNTRAVNLDKLEYVDGVSVVVTSGATSFFLPAFSQTGRTSDNLSYLQLALGSATVVNLAALIDFPDFSFLQIDAAHIAANPINALQTINGEGSEIALNIDGVEVLTFGSFMSAEGIGSALTITGASLTTLNFPALATLDDNFVLTVVAENMVDVNFSALTNIPGGITIDLQGSALTNDALNNILLRVSTAAVSDSNGTLNVSGGTIPAPDSTGLTYRNNLIAKGWAVTTN